MDDWLNYWVEKMNERGHASMFGRGRGETDRRIIEATVLQEWAEASNAEFSLDISSYFLNQDDPPDACAEVEGRKCSVELTELVDGEVIAMIKADRRAGKESSSNHGQLFQSSQWDSARFSMKLQEIVRRKDELYKSRNVSIDYLVIYSDEPWLRAEDVENWTRKFLLPSPTSICAVHILLTYQPGWREHWPVFEVSQRNPTDQGNSAASGSGWDASAS